MKLKAKVSFLTALFASSLSASAFAQQWAPVDATYEAHGVAAFSNNVYALSNRWAAGGWTVQVKSGAHPENGWQDVAGGSATSLTIGEGFTTLYTVTSDSSVWRKFGADMTNSSWAMLSRDMCDHSAPEALNQQPYRNNITIVNSVPLVITEMGRVRRWDSGNNCWNLLAALPAGAGFAVGISALPRNSNGYPETVYAVNGAGKFYYLDGADNWQPINDGTGNGLTYFQEFNTGIRSGWIVGSNNTTLWKYTFSSGAFDFDGSWTGASIALIGRAIPYSSTSTTSIRKVLITTDGRIWVDNPSWSAG